MRPQCGVLLDSRLELPRAASKPLNYLLPTFTDYWGRQSEYLYMKHHLDNSNLVGHRIVLKVETQGEDG